MTTTDQPGEQSHPTGRLRLAGGRHHAVDPRPPAGVPMPSLARGVCWSDVVAEIEREQRAREERDAA